MKQFAVRTPGHLWLLLFVGLVSIGLGCSEPPPTPEDREAMIERDRERSMTEMQQVREAQE